MLTLLERVNSIFFYRFTFLGVLLFSLGIIYDMRWHAINPIRAHYFILPHIIIYFGILVILFGFLAMKLKKTPIPIWIFVLFPISSLFDDFWHRFFGVELSTSPMMFWSPAHWVFGLIILYILYILIKIDIERNEVVNLLARSLLFMGIIRFVYYLLIPLSPYSGYINLHSVFNIIVPLVFVLAPITLYRIVGNQTVFLFSLIMLSMTSTREWNFFVGNNYVYSADKTLYFILMCTFFFAISTGRGITQHILFSNFILAVFFTLALLSGNSFSYEYMLYATLILNSFSVLYFAVEEALVAYLDQKGYKKRVESFFQ